MRFELPSDILKIFGRESLVGKKVSSLLYAHPADWDWDTLSNDDPSRPMHEVSVGGTITLQEKDGVIVTCNGLRPNGQPCGYTELQPLPE